MLPASLTFDTIEKENRSLNAENLKSIDQRASKLPAVKIGVLKKKSAASAIPPKLCAIAFGPGWIPAELESFSKFDSQQL